MSSPLDGKPLAYRCLALTGTFETNQGPPGCFSTVAGNFDGQGISFGACQWNLGQGTLQTMLNQAIQTIPSVVAAAFGDEYPQLQDMLAQPRAQQLTWAQSIQSPKFVLAAPWNAHFAALGSAPEFQAVEVNSAARMYQSGLTLCKTYQVNSERAAALMFDIMVQNGGISSAVQALIMQDHQALDPSLAASDMEVARLQSVANRRAEAANPRWIEDVRTRKLMIANGAGTVHGRVFDLENQYGITLAAIA